MKVTDFLESNQDEELAAVQGYVPKELRQEVIEQMQKDKKSGIKVNWNSLLEACLKSYLHERRPKRAGA